MNISGGDTIAGPKIKAALVAHPAVTEVEVVGIPDPERGQCVKAFVVLHPGHTPGPETVRALHDFVIAAIAPCNYPLEIELLAALPIASQFAVQRGPIPTPGSPPLSGHLTTPHQVLAPADWPRPKGYANGIAATGRLVFVAGQIGWNECGEFPRPDVPGQVEQALRNTLAVLREAGAGPEHVVRQTWYVTSRDEYLAGTKEIGATWRALMGRNYPTMAVVQVTALMETAAKVEIETTAVIPQ